jgi:O-antigen/teichoic acid export membrane protein
MSSERTTAGRLALNSLCSVSVNLFTALIGFFLTPFILSRMGDQRYGIWAVLGSVYAYSMILQLGLYSAINRHIPMHLARNDEAKIRNVTSTTTAFFAALGLIVVVLTVALAGQLLAMFEIPKPLFPASKIALYMLGIVVSLCLALNSFGAVLSGYQRYELMALGRLIPMAIRVALVITLLRQGEPLLVMALIFGTTECLIGALNLCFAWRLLPKHPLQVRAIRWTMLSEMFAYGVNTLAYAVGAVVVAKSGEIIIGAFLPPEQITYYSLALMPPILISGMVESFAASLKPAISDLDARNDIRRIRELTLLAQKYVLVFVLPAMAFFLIMGRNFYAIWLHREANETLTLLYILGPGHLIRAAQFPLFLVLAGRGEHRVFGLMALGMGLGAVALSVFFLRGLGWGANGVALGSTLAMTIICGVLLPYYCARRLGLQVSDFALGSWLPAACGVAPAILTLALWKTGRPPTTPFELLLVLTSTALVLLVSIWVLALNPTERTRFKGIAFTSIERFVPLRAFEKVTRLRRL